MTLAELPDLLEEPTFRAAFASFGGARPGPDADASARGTGGAPPPANDTMAAEDGMSSSALLRFGAALVVAGGAVIVGVLLAAVTVRVRWGLDEISPRRPWT